MSDLPGDVRTVLHPNQADNFKVQLRKSLEDGTWGQTDLLFDGFEKLVRSPPPTGTCAPSPNPTVISSLSTLTSDPSIISGQGPNNNNTSYSATPTCMVGNHAHSEIDPPTSDGCAASSNPPIMYYCVPPGGGVPSPGSSHNSPQAPPILDGGSPAHSSMRGGGGGGGYDVRSPPGSAVPSPASSSIMGVAGTASPAPSFVSSVHSGQRAMVPPPMMMASGPKSGNYSFSPNLPSLAIASTFGNLPTNSVPNLTSAPPPPHGFSSIPGINQVSDPEVEVILDGFNDTNHQQQQQQQTHFYPNWNGNGPHHQPHSQNWNGTGSQQQQQQPPGDCEDDITELLQGLIEPNKCPAHNNNYDITADGSGGIPHAHHHHHHHMMSGNVTVSSSSAAAAKEGVMVVGASQGGMAMDNSDQMDQFIAQLINSS